MIKLYFLKTFLFCLFLSLALSEGSLKAQVLSPSQTGHYATSIINVRDMAKAPPGLFLLSYNYYAFSNTYVDKNGMKHNSIELEDGSIEDMNINAFATLPAIFWGAKTKVLGASYMIGIVPNFIHAKATFLDEKNGSTDGSPETLTSNISGWSDLFVSPLTLTWSLKHFDLTASYTFAAPTGRFSFGADDNIGTGYWSHQFQGFGYYYPIVDQSTALMLGLTYEVNGDIKGVDANVGNRLALEWGLSQYVSDRLELGIQGGSYWQIADDTGSDVKYDASVHDKSSTVGFMAGYWVWENRLELIFKYNRDFAVSQNFEKNAFMLNAVFLTNALTGSKNKAPQ